MESKTARTAILSITNISGMFKAAWERGLIDELPVRKWPKPKRPRLHYETLTQDEIESVLYEASKTSAYDIIQFMAFTGLRVSDAAALKWRDVHGDQIEIVIQKTDAPLRISLAAPAIEALDRARKSRIVRLDGTVFLNNFGREWKATALDRYLNRIGMASIGRSISSKIFRQTVVTELIRSGLDRAVVRQITGHSSNAIEAYIHLTHKDTSGIIERLMPRVTKARHPDGTSKT
jgi:integrase